MMSLFRFIFAVFCFTAILILAVYLRSDRRRIFYQLCMYRAEQSRLKQQLGNKQLQLEGLLNPAAILQHLETSLRHSGPRMDTD